MTTLSNTVPAFEWVPNDLRAWHHSWRLVEIILELTPNAARLAAESGVLCAQTQAWLGLLTYAYGTGTFSSPEIEAAVRHDEVMHYLAAGRSPSAGELRSLRRQHRSALKEALTSLFIAAWRQRLGDEDPAGGHKLDSPSSLVVEHCLAAVAEERLQYAAFLDSMALDD